LAWWRSARMAREWEALRRVMVCRTRKCTGVLVLAAMGDGWVTFACVMRCLSSLGGYLGSGSAISASASEVQHLIRGRAYACAFRGLDAYEDGSMRSTRATAALDAHRALSHPQPCRLHRPLVTTTVPSVTSPPRPYSNCALWLCCWSTAGCWCWWKLGGSDEWEESLARKCRAGFRVRARCSKQISF
jgi:hypothetical protein